MIGFATKPGAPTGWKPGQSPGRRGGGEVSFQYLKVFEAAGGPKWPCGRDSSRQRRGPGFQRGVRGLGGLRRGVRGCFLGILLKSQPNRDIIRPNIYPMAPYIAKETQWSTIIVVETGRVDLYLKHGLAVLVAITHMAFQPMVVQVRPTMTL